MVSGRKSTPASARERSQQTAAYLAEHPVQSVEQIHQVEAMFQRAARSDSADHEPEALAARLLNASEDHDAREHLESWLREAEAREEPAADWYRRLLGDLETWRAALGNPRFPEEARAALRSYAINGNPNELAARLPTAGQAREVEDLLRTEFPTIHGLDECTWQRTKDWERERTALGWRRSVLWFFAIVFLIWLFGLIPRGARLLEGKDPAVQAVDGDAQ